MRIVSRQPSERASALNARSRHGTFWGEFLRRAFGPPSSPGDDTSPQGTRALGRVTLVGAGPGDAELLTLKAVRALQAADVILFDDLVSDEVLDLARREAKRILVGKRGGRESCRQDDINDMMVKLAKAGRHVVRLKSGDPMIFGRAGEEIARLDAEGIPIEVVPGITTALAMASALGVSLTHRDHAKSVRFVTGHAKNGDLPDDIDWRALSDPSATTVFYMGGRTAAGIADRLLATGLPPEMPVVVAAAITRPSQRIQFCSLDALADAIAEIGVSEPVIIGIGAVFASRARTSREVAEPAGEQIKRRA